MSGDATPLPVKAQYYCAAHGQTNNVLGLDGQVWCLSCVAEVVKASCMPVFRAKDLA